jgi:hypothetical protein
MQTDRFPAPLVKIAGELCVGRELSTYPLATDERDDTV